MAKSVTAKAAVPPWIFTPCPNEQPPPKVRPSRVTLSSAFSKAKVIAPVAIPSCPLTLDHRSGLSGTLSEPLPAASVKAWGFDHHRSYAPLPLSFDQKNGRTAVGSVQLADCGSSEL